MLEYNLETLLNLVEIAYVSSIQEFNILLNLQY
jgi:hypothetical protein